MSDVFKRNLDRAGYSPEELYFHEKNQELRKKQQDRSHLRLIDGGKKDHVVMPSASASGLAKKAA